uniref:Uncharacterized protein n=1 Tax=Romanomermis culicivorax TaxID=13658 RepID=A0A915ID95_ROMCU
MVMLLQNKKYNETSKILMIDSNCVKNNGNKLALAIVFNKIEIFAYFGSKLSKIIGSEHSSTAFS